MSEQLEGLDAVNTRIGELLDVVRRLEDTVKAQSAVAGWMGAEELGAYLGISGRQVNRLARTGKLPPPKLIGTLRKWQAEAVDRRILSGRAGDRGKRKRGAA